MAFAPQNHDVVVLLEVQLRGEDEWLGVRISCPLIQTKSDGTPLIPACEWRPLTGPRSATFISVGPFYSIVLLHGGF